MAASTLDLNPARARAPSFPRVLLDQQTAAGDRQPLLLWHPVLAAAIGSAFLVAALFLLVPHRHVRAAVTEVASTTLLAAEQPAGEVAPDPAPAAPPAPPVKTVFTPPTFSLVKTPAVPLLAEPEAVAEQPAPPPLPNPPAVVAKPLVNCAGAVGAEVTRCPHYGTTVDFYDSPAAATQNALEEQKLVFMLHVAGNFEEPGFT